MCNHNKSPELFIRLRICLGFIAFEDTAVSTTLHSIKLGIRSNRLL